MDGYIPKVGDMVWYDQPNSGWAPCALTITEITEPDVYATGWIMEGETEPYRNGRPLFMDLEAFIRYATLVPLNTLSDIESFLEN